MKYISFAIPCYNSEAYMEKAINSILVGGEDVEIIVVNDGSKDGTQEIAERYQSSLSTTLKYFPVACSSPQFTASPCPPFGFATAFTIVGYFS